MHRDWAPIGYDRFMELVKDDFFTDQLIYRTIPGFLVQMGVAADPQLHAQWDQPEKRLPDEPNPAPFRRGTLSFAGLPPLARAEHTPGSEGGVG